MKPPPFPVPVWIDLRTEEGKLVARFDPCRGLLEVQEHWHKTTFDLAKMVKEFFDQPNDLDPKT